MEFLQNLLDSTNVPVLSAFILGLMAAISPCPLATNITAIGYIGKNIVEKRRIFINGLYYTVGRAISYTILGIVLYFGASKFHIARFFSDYGEKILGPLLILAGILMLEIFRINFPSFNRFTEKLSGKAGSGSGWGALFLGIVFALAFCPYSGVLFFGMLIPITISSASGLYLPLIFAVATGLPVIIIAYIIAFSISGLATFYKSMQLFQKWLNRVVAFVFIGAGIYFVVIFYIIK